jgi:hypothetical protein
MRSLFQYGFDCAQTGPLWVASAPVASIDSDRGGERMNQSVCPADDVFISRFAVR